MTEPRKWTAAAILFALITLTASAVNASGTKEQSLKETQEQWWSEQSEIDYHLSIVEQHRRKQSILHEHANDLRNQLCSEGDRRYCPPTYGVRVTTYNDLEEQTDSTPCSGAGGDICKAYREDGLRPLALSKDLRAKYGLKYGDKVWMESPIPHCANGEYIVMDNLPSRSGVDIFVPQEKRETDNTSCKATLFPTTPNHGS